MTAEQPASTRRGRLTRNSVFAVAPRFATIAVAIGLSPYIVSQVGLAAFGFWSIVQAVIAFAQIADGGIPMVATRHIAQAQERSDERREREVLALTVVVMAMLATSLFLLAALVVWLLPEQMGAKLPTQWAPTALLGAAAFAMSMFGRSLASVAYGHHRWEVEAVVATSVQVATAAATIVALHAGAGLPGLGVGVVAGAITGIVGYGASVHFLIGIRLRGARPSWSLWREMRRQGVNLQVVAFVAAVNAQSDRLLLIPFASLSWIGAYSLGARVAVSLRAFPVAALAPLIAHISAVDAGSGREAVRATYHRVLSLVTEYGTGLLIVAYAAMCPAVLVWLGSEYGISAAAASLLGVGFAINILTGPGTTTAIACGRAELDRDYNILGLVLNLALSATLGVVFGPWGVVAATTIGLVLSSAWLLVSVDRWLPANGIRTVTRGTGGAALITAFAVGTCIVGVTAALAPASRLENLAIAVAGTGVGTVLVARHQLLARIKRGSVAAG